MLHSFQFYLLHALQFIQNKAAVLINKGFPLDSSDMFSKYGDIQKTAELNLVGTLAFV